LGFQWRRFPNYKNITLLCKWTISKRKTQPTLDNNDNVQIGPNNFVVDTIIGFEDVAVIFDLDAYDVEGDDFTVKIFDCDPTQGKFYGPSSQQFYYIDSNGDLQIPTTNVYVT